MSLQTLGEFGLIDLIDIPAYAPEQMILGRGDDCAVLPFNDTQYQVLSCDLLVEDVHFIRNKITPQQLGYKSVAVNLSDVAAMGGRPVHILLSLALPPDYTATEWKGFYQGVDEICRKYGVNVIGGDTTSSKDRLAINVTVLGLVEKEHLHLRSDARPGDVVFVTGYLGGSRAGLEVMLDNAADLPEEHREKLIQCHCRPEPCCEEIAVLNRLAGNHLHALNDVSDGLLSECSEIAAASNMAVVLYPERVPIHESCRYLAGMNGADALKWAMTGGEDYQLAGTMAPDKAEEICAAYEQETGKKLTIVGFVESGNGVYLLENGQRRLAEQRGFNHFKTEKADSCEEEQNVTGQLLQQHFAELAQQEEELRIYRHDFQNHMACLSGLLQCGETEQALQYLKQMTEAVPQNPQIQYSQRNLLNILLNQKADQARQKGIDVEIHCTDGLLDFISDYDLCTLLGNLLDNGIDHSGTWKDAYLYLDIINGSENDIIIRMENSCGQPPDMRDGSLATGKKDALFHGKGMKQIQRMVNRYGGEFSWMYDDMQKRFITKCKFLKIS
ncbi:MAG: thiamine-phosphate kinase [Peptococcaceae bacterium]|nr:thiamine-phosphate kinase [Peptococcaceae bacterium]